MPSEIEQLLEIPELATPKSRPEIQKLIELYTRTNELLVSVADNQKRQSEMLETLLSQTREHLHKSAAN